MSTPMSERWFVSRLSDEQSSRTVVQGNPFHNRLIAVFATPELAAEAVAKHNAALDDAATAIEKAAEDAPPTAATNAAEPEKPAAAPKRRDPRDLDREVAWYLIRHLAWDRGYGRAELQAAMQALGIWHYETENLVRSEVRLDQRFGVKS